MRFRAGASVRQPEKFRKELKNLIFFIYIGAKTQTSRVVVFFNFKSLLSN